MNKCILTLVGKHKPLGIFKCMVLGTLSIECVTCWATHDLLFDISTVRQLYLCVLMPLSSSSLSNEFSDET